jgi:hypothetical protein
LKNSGPANWSGSRSRENNVDYIITMSGMNQNPPRTIS